MMTMGASTRGGRRAVPNEVYVSTRDALATLVSERAATRMLDAALRRSSLSADTLDAGAVRKLLLGPVQRELEGILPRTGLRRTLRRLARQVADASPVTHAAPTPVTAATAGAGLASAELHPVTRSSVYLPDVEIRQEQGEAAATEAAPTDAASGEAATAEAAPLAAAAAGWPVADPGGAAAAVAVADDGGPRPDRQGSRRRRTGARPAPPQGAATAPTVVPRALSPETLDRLTVRFAEIEGVTQVIGLRDRNAPPQVRGDGIDPDALAPLARSAVRLLSRHGPVRSLVLEHDAGLLFVFPLGRDTVAVLASTDVNMGAVFAARAALEEA